MRPDINEATQPPEVSKQIKTALQPLIALPAGYPCALALVGAIRNIAGVCPETHARIGKRTSGVREFATLNTTLSLRLHLSL